MTTLFLSYARGDDEPFVRRLYADLTSRGFDVWWDRVSMPSRQLTFHQEIKDAIRNRDRLVYVAGPQAAISDYVREEWQFALELDRAVIPILRKGDHTVIPGELSLLHCDDFRDDAQYPRQFAKLVDNLTRPEPPLGALFGVPNLPPHFLRRPHLLRRVKDALLVDLQKPVVVTSETSRVGMQGMGGIGKSVLAVALGRDHEIRRSYPDGVLWVAVGQQPDLAQLQRDVARHLGSQEQFETAAQGKGLLRRLLLDKAVLLVLDDVWKARDVMAFDVLGPRCRVLITTRDAGVLHTLHGELIPVSLFTEEQALQLLADAVGTQRAVLLLEAREIVRECGCLPLAVALCGGMARKHSGEWAKVIERLRRADLDKIADREAINPQHESIWRAMQASVDVLPADEQHRFAELAVFEPSQTVPEAAVAMLWAYTGNLDDLDTDELLINLAERSLIRLDVGPSHQGILQRRIGLHELLHHFAGQLAGEAKSLHDTLLAAYANRCADGWPSGPNDGYYFQNLRYHLAKAERTGELVELLYNLRWLEAKNEHGLVFDLVADFHAAIDALPPGNPQRRILGLLDEGLRRDIHFIARHSQDYPQALFQCLWNNCWWYDCAEVAQHYDQSPVPSLDAAKPWQQPDPRLCSLLEAWRSARASQACFPWLRSLRPPRVPLGTGQLACLRGHTGGVSTIALSYDNQYIVSGGVDKIVRIWDIDSRFPPCCLLGHEASVSSVALSSREKLAASTAADRTVRMWDIVSGEQLRSFRFQDRDLVSLALSPDGRWIAAGDAGGTVWIRDAENETDPQCCSGHTGAVWSLACSPDSRTLVSASDDSTVRLWDLCTGASVACLCGHDGSVACVDFSPEGHRIVSAGDDSTIRIWDTLEHRETGRLIGQTRSILSVAFSPDAQYVVSGGVDGIVRIWHTDSGIQDRCFHGHDDIVTSVLFSRDGRHVISASMDGTIRVWDRTTIQSLLPLDLDEERILYLRFSAAGDRLATVSSQRTVRVWDTHHGHQLAQLQAQQDVYRKLGYSRDGRRLVLQGSTLVQVWDLQSLQRLVAMPGVNDFIDEPIHDSRPSWRLTSCGSETQLQSTVTRSAEAWFPLRLDHVAVRPASPVWAGIAEHHVVLLRLEETPSATDI